MFFSQIIYDRDTGKSRRFGFVTFEEEKSMTDAIMIMDVEESRSKCVNVGSITVEVARQRRKNRSAEFALELVRLINEKQKKMAGL